MSLTEDIKDFALDLGYSRVGITTADPFPGYIAELKARQDMYAFYINRPTSPLKGAEPRSVMPSAKSIIMVVFDAFKESFPDKLVGKIGRIYQARCYLPPAHRINGARYRLMRDFLENNGCHVHREIRVPERLAACRAGAVTYGKNGFAFTDGIGSFVIISAFVIDRELEYDAPTYEVKCPPTCTLCIDACPTGSLYEPMKIDPRLCIGFNHWTTQGKEDSYVGTVGSYIPPEIREKMGEILTPGYPVAKGITQLTHDVEMARWFNGIAANPEWALPKKADVAIPEGWKQLPSNKKLGSLSEAYVHPEIRRDLEEAIHVMTQPEKVWRKTLGAWKYGKVIISPKTQRISFMTGHAQLHFQLHPFGIARNMPAAGTYPSDSARI